MTYKFTRRMLCISTAILSVAGAFAAPVQAADTIKLGIVAPMSGPNAREGVHFYAHTDPFLRRGIASVKQTLVAHHA